MKNPTVAWKNARNAEQVIGTLRKVVIYSGVPTFGPVETDITLLLKQNSISLITSRIERNLNEFQPSNVSIRCKNKDVFYNIGKTGLFDPVNVNKPYQVKIWVGLEGIDFISPAIPNCLMFDGKIENGSAKRIDRKTVEFSVYGWLKNAEDYSAEEIADPDNPPFKNISGLLFVSITENPGAKGAKEINYSIDSNNKKWLSFDGGEKVEITGDGNFNLEDSVKENTITIQADISEMPIDNQIDNFTVIPQGGGGLIACYWWENRTLEFIVSKLLTKINVTTQDIDVRELETNLSKLFIYLPPILQGGTPIDMKITCVKVVDITGTVITIVMGIEIEKGVLSKLYKVVIDIDNPTNYSYFLIATEVSNRFCKFVYFGGKTWVVTGNEEAPNTWLGLKRWRAHQIRRFSADWSTLDFDKFIGWGLYSFYLAYSFSEKYSTDNVYALKTEFIAGTPGHWKFGLRRYDFSDDTWYDVKYPLRIDSFPDNWGVYAIQNSGAGSKHFFYYGTESEASPGTHQCRRYNISDDIDSQIWLNGMGDPVDEIIRFVWERFDGTFNRLVFGKFKKATGISTFFYSNFWVNPDGSYSTEDEGAVNKTKYMNENNLHKDYFTSWFVEGTKWYIKTFNSLTKETIKETTPLQTNSVGDISAPLIYKHNGADIKDLFYAGFIVDKGTSIVPFLYLANRLPTIRIAKFTGFSCRDALKYLAQGYLDILDIYERDKARFYFRETFNGTDTIDYDFYRHTPKIEQWNNFCDGVIIENSRENIRARIGNTSFGAKVIHIDNRFISEGTAKPVAEWMYNFFNRSRRIITVKVPMYLEIELMDKITITLRDENDNITEAIDTIIYEKSINPSPGSNASKDMILKLLEIQGVAIHIPVLIPTPDHKLLEIV